MVVLYDRTRLSVYNYREKATDIISEYRNVFICMQLHTSHWTTTNRASKNIKPALTAGLLSPTPSVPQLQCQEAESCPAGGKQVCTRMDQVKESTVVTGEQNKGPPPRLEEICDINHSSLLTAVPLLKTRHSSGITGAPVKIWPSYSRTTVRRPKRKAFNFRARSSARL